MPLTTLFARLSPEERHLSDYISNILGFRPKNIALFKVAFTHRSKSDENVGNYHVSNERMEYLGDAVLSIAVADYLFRTYPTQPEGFLTEMRSKIVSRSSLNHLSQKLGLDQYIKFNSERNNDAAYKSLGGNAFEALMGAIYLDRGFDFAKHVIIDRILRVHIDLEQLRQTETNFKSKLLEWAQKKRKQVEFKLLEEIAEKKRKRFHVQIFINNKPFADYTDLSIKRAEQAAAEKTLAMLSKNVTLQHESERQK